ncbi:purple acid phosphatase 17-like isoform A [Micractinium conductrix]|uniref:Purple acid phosphatase 17-like isoform A n=1 Tax=Micractinium conductrix TaxID=554055 RepID=A0A2P6VCA3_9CHLO|nr:purple acid phosphatase 17-like isoform A [Micractinium conductrix]|eukprot:PSC71727.1 purple acid phosphatase 17-like isoform A [Micractinium conductrix]
MTAAQEPLLPPSRASGLEAGGSSSRLFEELPWQIPHRRQSGAGLRLCASLVLVVTAAAALQGTVMPSLCARGWRWGCACAPPDAAWPRFLVVGDWGRRGAHNQTHTAKAMARRAAAMGAHFVVSTGDNIYPSGLLSPADPAFKESFTHVYHQRSLQDYGESNKPDNPACGAWDEGCFFSPLHQLDARLAQRDPRWRCACSYSLQFASGQVELFFIDTTPLMAETYEKAPWRDNRGGLTEQSWEAQLVELEAQLSWSAARWKLAVGHHPIRTNHRAWGHVFKEMQERVEPLLIRYGVAAYFNGHDHNLQHLHAPEAGYHQITSGAGSRVSPKFFGTKDSPFQHGGSGFVAVTMQPQALRVEYWGIQHTDQPLFAIDVPPR